VARLALVAATGVSAAPRMSARMASVRRAERVVRPAASIAVAVALLLVLTAACTRSDGDAPKPASARPGPSAEPFRITGTEGDDATAPEATPNVSPVPDAVSSAAASLDRLLTDPGNRFRRLPDTGPGRGPLDLERAASAEPDVQAERALLETRGFMFGLGRLWKGAAKDTVYSAVYDFASPEGAAAYLEDGALTLEAKGASLYPVEGLAGARGFSLAERRSATGASVTTHGVTFVVGVHFHLLFHATSEPGLTPGFITDLAGRTAARPQRDSRVHRVRIPHPMYSRLGKPTVR
jgi:hypothetical protein